MLASRKTTSESDRSAALGKRYTVACSYEPHDANSTSSVRSGRNARSRQPPRTVTSSRRAHVAPPSVDRHTPVRVAA